MARHPLDRMPPLELIKISRDEYDRLVELSPFMPSKVILDFNHKFKKNIDLSKPEICDELLSTGVFLLLVSERSKLSLMFDKQAPKEDPNVLRQRKKQKQVLDQKTEKFKQTFLSLNGRYPNPQEISKHMSKFVDSAPAEPVQVNEVDLEMNSLGNDRVTLDIEHAIEETNTDDVLVHVDNDGIEDPTNNQIDDNENNEDGGPNLK